MKYIEANMNKAGKELLLDSDFARVIHAHLEKGGKIPAHSSKFNVVVTPIKGRVFFSNGKGEGEEIYPGKIVVMEKDDIHELTALEDSDVIVTHILN